MLTMTGTAHLSLAGKLPALDYGVSFPGAMKIQHQCLQSCLLILVK